MEMETTDRNFNTENSSDTGRELNDLRNKYNNLEGKYSQALAEKKLLGDVYHEMKINHDKEKIALSKATETFRLSNDIITRELKGLQL
jgi:hypothetical protein